MELFKLFGTVMIENKEAISALNDLDKKGATTQKSMSSNLIDKFKGLGAKMLTAMGVVIVVKALGDLVAKTVDTTSAIQDSADKAGTNAEAYQEWAYAAKLASVEQETLDNLMVKQQKSFSDATEGTKTQSEAYKRLGIDITKVGSSSDAFDLVIERLADMENETERNALANDIFGRSYTDLNPLLKGGSDAIAKTKQEARDLGLIMSNETVASGEELGDTFDKIKGAVGMMGMSIGTALMPAIQAVSDIFLELVPIINPVVKLFSQVLVKAFGALAKPIGELVEKLMPPLLEIFEAFMPLLDLLTPILELISVLLTPIIDAIAWLVDLIAGILTPVIEEISGVLKSVLGGALEFVSGIFKSFGGIAKSVWDGVSGTLTGIWNGISSTAKSVWGGIKDGISSTWTSLSNSASSIWNGVAGFFSRVWDGIKGTAKTAWSGISGELETAWSRLSTTAQTVWNGVSGFFTGIWNSIEGAAKAAWDKVNGVTETDGEEAAQTTYDKSKKMLDYFDSNMQKIKDSASGMARNVNAYINGIKSIKQIELRYNTTQYGSLQLPTTARAQFYATGAIFSKPTLFNTASGPKVVGDASTPEVVAPLSDLKEMLGDINGGGDTYNYNFTMTQMPTTDAEKRRLAQIIEEERRRATYSRGMVTA